MKIDRNNDITAKDVKRLLLKVYRGLKTGEITEVQANRECTVLNSILKAIEITDLEERLSSIERVLRE